MNSARKFFTFFLFSIFSIPQVFSSQNETTCGTTNVQRPANQIGGAYVTATGTIKALFIFIDFPEDNEDINNVVLNCTPKTGPLAKVEKISIFHSRRPVYENRTTQT